MKLFRGCKVSKPVKVKFYTKGGKRVAFRPHQRVIKPVKVEFYIKRNEIAG
jgi:hypothetical protein